MTIQAQNTTLSVSSDSGTTYNKVGAIQTIGDIDFGAKDVITIDSLDSEIIDKVLGTLKLGSLDLSYTYDPDEPNGNGVIKAAFDATTTTPIKVQIELPNPATASGTGTLFTFDAIVPSYKLSGLEKNGFMKSSTSLEMTSKPVVTAAV
ncbi:hypothetical protein [Sulfurospirillum sp. 1612]|uniref:hypothetical protein n=1 Tax=Sulfurospirillum sp. 1612 TaxID=3094835 RepID=UPI002F92A61B